MAGGGSGPKGRSEFRGTVEVSGVEETVHRFLEQGYRAYNTLPLTESIKETLAKQQKVRVESEPWAPLTEGTIARKISQDENPEILHDEWRPIKGKPTRVGNKLWLALTLDGATGQIKRATRTWAIFGVDSAGNRQLFYARFVQNVKGKKRRILAISESDALTILQMVGDWIKFGKL